MLSGSVLSDSATPWTAAHQAPLSMGLSRQEDWSGLSFPPPRDLPDPGIKPGSPALQEGSEPCGKLRQRERDMLNMLGLLDVLDMEDQRPQTH